MQKIQGYGTRTLLIGLVFAITGLAFFSLIWVAGNHGDGTKLWIGIGGFVGSAIAMMTTQAVRERRFHCPTCGQRIPVRYRDSGPNWDRGRYRVQFFCPRCDTIWDTGLRH